MPADYTNLFIDHFQNPRNVGRLEEPDAIAKMESPVCGDLMEIYLQIEDDTITDVKFRTFGCAAAIASSSMASELITGKTVDEALALTDENVAEALGGLPEKKMHCSNLAASAIRKALLTYRDKGDGNQNET
jgi:nitrogen fixation NifU-like protein